MLGKKDPEPAKSPEEQALEQRVDKMMNPEQRASSPTSEAKPTTPGAAGPPIDIFKDPKTAPEVPDNLLEKLGVQGKSAPPAKAEVEPPASTDQPVEPKAEDTAEDSTDLDDEATDKAVDAIAAADGDTILEVEDATLRPPVKKGVARGWKGKLQRLTRDKRAWAGLVVLVLVVIFAIPFTRYSVLGLFIKEPVTLTITDSTTGTPVSSAAVDLGGQSAKTNGEGKASFKVPVGNKHLTITKQYYSDYSGSVAVGLKSKTAIIHLVATGRQVPLTVIDKISGQPLAEVDIKILDTSAKTDSHGQATIVLPANRSTAQYTASLSGYATAQGNITVTNKVVAANTIPLLASGSVYFLSNLSGKIDVVKTNLDGSNRQTVLAGTGQEDPNNTTLLASRDWRYLVLESQRNGGNPALFLISTNNDKVTEFDSANATFTLIGWDGHNFLYESQSNAVPQSQSGYLTIKSYDADTAQLNQLDQNQVQGTSDSYGYQTFQNFYIVSNQLVYTTEWYSYDSTGSGYDLSSLNDTIRGIQPDGQSKKDYQSFAANGVGYIQAVLYKPQAIYYQVNSNNGGATTDYDYANQSVSTVSLSQNDFSQTYPTYLLSPSGNSTFWTELRDGQNTLFVGDDNAASPKQIASLSDYSPYGWYSDNYVLVSKNDSELYIMPASGLAVGQAPLKVSDYYKPNQNFNGYGYGYGGL
jgi:hypothetical protein